VCLGGRLTPRGAGIPPRVPWGPGYLAKGPVTPTGIFRHVADWSGAMLGCGRLNRVCPLPASGWGFMSCFVLAVVVCEGQLASFRSSRGGGVS